MVFSNLIFLFLFLPIFILVYFIFKKRKIRNLVLLIFSLLFYAYGEPIYVFLMIGSIIVNYLMGLKLKKNKKLFICSIIFNLLILFVFKYLDFLISTINLVFKTSIPLFNISLPIGISFYTFQTISYLVSVYKGNVKSQKNIIDLGCYIAAFPQLIAGPIVRYETVNEELINRKENFKDFASGIRRFIVGLSKKVLIADYLGLVASRIFQYSGVGFIAAWIGMICYTLQIYYDFSGYSDMAIGLGRMLGFHYLENFDYPYISKSITEFFRRWHMSLSSFFKDYVYIPLGGNRVSKVKLIRNIIVVWFLTGLWHGANFNFILWGVYYGVFLVIEKFFLKKHLDKHNTISHFYLLLVTIIGWVIFRSESFTEIKDILASMFMFNGLGNIKLIEYIGIIDIKNILALVFGIVFAIPVIKNLDNKKVYFDILLIIIFIISILSIVNSSYSPFIYFRF